jgi:predicted permease
MHSISNDIRYALRGFRRSPLFAVVAVLSLAFGIGANTAIFSLLDQVLLRLLPVKQPEQLVIVAERGLRYGSSWGDNDISYPMYEDFRDHNQVFSGMFCRFGTSISLSAGTHAERVDAELVSGSYFPVLGVTAALGRILTPDDDRIPGGHPVVMLSYRFWQTRFSSDRSIIGKTILLNENRMTVIGVVQPGFDGVDLGSPSKVFVPVMMQAQVPPPYADGLKARRLQWVTAFGRLKPGIGIEQARASLQPLMHSILELEIQEPALRHYSEDDRQRFLHNRVDLLAGSQGWSDLREEMATPLRVLIALTGAVLLLACANLASLLLARAAMREKEMAVRLAIGAGRFRIVRQLIVESLLLAIFGGLAGLGLAYMGDHLLLVAYLPPDSAGDFAISAVPDFRVRAFTLATMLGAAVVFGLAPAIHGSRADIAPTLKDQAGSVVRGGRVLARKLLVGAQITLSLVLLIGAGLFLGTLANLQNQGPGFSTERLMSFTVNPTLNGYTSPRTRAFYEQLMADLETAPGITSVGSGTMPILKGYAWHNPVIVEGQSTDPGVDEPPVLCEISPNYFATLGIPVLAGRDFTARDGTIPMRAGGSPYSFAIINESFARKYFQGRNPIGLRMGTVDDRTAAPDVPMIEVVGVVKDAKYMNLRDAAPPQAYFPYLEADHFRYVTVYLRTRSRPEQAMEQVRGIVRRLDPDIPIYDMRTIEEDIGRSLKTERLVADLSGVFSGLATLLAVVGLYGVMAWTVTRRTREIGIRMALGALPGDVIGMVMREVLTLIGAGVAIGVPLALALSGLIRTQLYGVQPHDPVTVVCSTLALAAVAALAGFIPAMRASRVDPTRALRYE